MNQSIRPNNTTIYIAYFMLLRHISNFLYFYSSHLLAAIVWLSFLLLLFYSSLPHTFSSLFVCFVCSTIDFIISILQNIFKYWWLATSFAACVRVLQHRQPYWFLAAPSVTALTCRALSTRD